MSEELNLSERFCYILKAKNYSHNSIRNYKNRLLLFLAFFHQKDIQCLSKKDFKKYFLYCIKVKNYSTSSLKQQLNFIKLFFKTVYERELKFDFSKYLTKENKLPVILSKDEVTKILQCITNVKHKLIIAVIYSCGLMLQETINLKTSDIIAQKNIIKIMQLNGNKYREVMLSEKLLVMFETYYRIYKPEVWLFENKAGKQYSPRSVQAIFERALKKSNIDKNVSIQTLRHSFAVHLLSSGTDVKYVQKLLGHNNIKTTQIYTYICKDCTKKIKSPFDMLTI